MADNKEHSKMGASVQEQKKQASVVMTSQHLSALLQPSWMSKEAIDP